MKHTLKLRPGNYVRLDTYTKGVHPLYPIVAISIIGILVIGSIISIKMHQASDDLGTVCPTDRSEHYGPGC